jgi:hypothetical protein
MFQAELPSSKEAVVTVNHKLHPIVFNELDWLSDAVRRDILLQVLKSSSRQCTAVGLVEFGRSSQTGGDRCNLICSSRMTCPHTA